MQSLEQWGNLLIDKPANGIWTTAREVPIQALKNQGSLVFENSKQIKKKNQFHWTSSAIT